MHTSPALDRLSARPREVEALSALITRVTSTLDMDEVLDHATEVCTALTGCAGALVYLWDEEQERLVIRGASDGYRHWVDAFSLRLGEGLTGWTALNRRPGMIAEDPLSDPRYKLVPELNDSRFPSALTVPVVGREDRLVGVLTLHTTAPHEFAEDDVRLMQAVAGLVAGAVENARLHDRAVRAATVFRRLAELSRELTAVSRGPQTLQRLALTALELLDASLVAILVLDEQHGRLVVETWVGGDGGAVRVDGVPASGLWARLLGGGPTSVALDRDEPFVRGLGLRVRPRSLFAAPLAFDGRPVGLLVCTASERRALGEDNLELLGVIANHAAIVLEEGRNAAEADERSRVRALFDALRAGDGAHDAGAMLGLRLDEPHAVVCVEPAAGADVERASRALVEAVCDVFPGTRGHLRGSDLTMLVPLRSERWEPLLERALEEALPAVGAAAGVSDSTAGSPDYALAFRQARMACAIGRASGPGRRVRGYRSLGAQRYLWAISQERDPDPLELAVGRLVEIDGRRGSELFRTLETYLDHQGNARRTAAALYVHRNTLRQRLRRIAELVGVDPTDRSSWLDLVLAVRLIRFRALTDA